MKKSIITALGLSLLSISTIYAQTELGGNLRLGSMALYADNASNHLIFNGSPDYPVTTNNWGNNAKVAGYVGKMAFHKATEGGEPGYFFGVSRNNVGAGVFANSFKPLLEAKTSGIGITGSSFALGTEDGKAIGTKTAQRALVHSTNDALALNWDGEFEGGVIVEGPQMRVLGKVNIGIVPNTTTNYALSVGGPIVAQNLKLIGKNIWADYVFEKDYALRSLKEVEDYVVANKHLPEVPAAKEIIENGMDASELFTIQMKKIEELTLYVIQQNKKIEALEKEIKQGK